MCFDTIYFNTIYFYLTHCVTNASERKQPECCNAALQPENPEGQPNRTEKRGLSTIF
jgi:hypothetical protein